MRISGGVMRHILYCEVFEKLKSLDPETQMEVPFKRIMPTRRMYRADFLCPKLRLIVEINGGQFVAGRHNRGGEGYENDITKINLAQINGYRVLQFTYPMLQRGEHLAVIDQLKG
jgi:very-short-patch-repair endonuclease